MAETKGLFRYASLPCKICLWQTGILPSAFLRRVEPFLRVRIYITITIKKCPHKGTFFYRGGDEGIRTLDTLASIPHFQCGALDQLCDVSRFLSQDYSSASDASGVSSPASSTPSFVSSTKEFSNSASISRNIGSSLAISKDTSSSAIAGASL